MHGNYGMERVPDMSGLFHAFKNTLWFKTTTWGRLYIHSWVFSMYNSLTSSYCTCMSFLVASRQFFGDPIICDDGHAGVGSDRHQEMVGMFSIICLDLWFAFLVKFICKYTLTEKRTSGRPNQCIVRNQPNRIFGHSLSESSAEVRPNRTANP